jgi:hypothetical protein
VQETPPARRRLSTGHTVSLPFELSCNVGGATFLGPAAALADAVPDGLRPVRVTPRLALVTVVAVSYHEASPVDPYDEVGVIVPTVASPTAALPLVAAATGRVGGYVTWLPVSTEASVALGSEVWGYQKEALDVSVVADDAGVSGTVRAGGETVLSLHVPPASGRARTATLSSYTTHEDRLCRTAVTLSGELGLRPRSQPSLAVETGARDGNGERAGDVAALVGEARPLGWFAGREVRARLAAPKLVAG